MPTINTVETKIKLVERFPRVAFVWNGVDVKGNKENIPQYKWLTAARGDWTLAEWKRGRFCAQYPGYDVRVFLKNGSIAPGNMKLSTIRDEK